MLDHPLEFFRTLRDEVKEFVDTGAGIEALKKAMPALREKLGRNERIRNFIGGSFDGMAEKVFGELGGK